MWRTTSLIALAMALGLGACGGDDPSPEEEVRGTLKTLVTSVEKRDYKTLCTKVLDSELTRSLSQVGETCDSALEKGFGGVRSPRLQIDAIKVNGTRASARVRTTAANQKPSTDTIELVDVKDVGWRVVSLRG